MQALKNGTSGFKNIFCAAEQFFPIHGHIPPLARLIKTPSFTNSVGLFLIDEGHHIVTDGQPHGNDPPHRPAYGKLGDVRVQLPAGTPCGIFSATLPPPVKTYIRSDLRMKEGKTVEINLCTNRPNIVQAVIPMVGNISNLSNLDLLVPVPYHPPMALLQRGIIFLDHKLSTAKVADYLNDRCPPGMRETGPFRHLHSGMSQDYIDMIYEAFKQPGSHIRMIVTTTAGSHVSHNIFFSIFDNHASTPGPRYP
jgi:superfamily II DNA helicase RecQ